MKSHTVKMRNKLSELALLKNVNYTYTEGNGCFINGNFRARTTLWLRCSLPFIRLDKENKVHNEYCISIIDQIALLLLSN